ncbi:alkylated DNA repair protein ALKBH8 homolog [Typha angustifolia]|uniref:alkylated DNA repair protein ALKBH8 homolog n=1 Tax=Typha angustifolia TaxID=59011 RepID=UPI003C2DDE20
MEDDADFQRRALVEAFGESSESEEETHIAADSSFLPTQERDHPKWEMVDGVKGLWTCPNFLSQKDQSLLLSAINREGWFSDTHNQAMRFGDLPEWAIDLSILIREAVCSGEIDSLPGMTSTNEDQELCPLPLDLLWREPLFDQLIGNVYEPGEGICAHVDLLRFDDGIAIISLESACVMHFTPSEPDGGCAETPEGEGSMTTPIPVYLKPGSLVLMSGEARYLWKHGINRKDGCQLWEGKEIQQGRRTSVTLRKLCQSLN